MNYPRDQFFLYININPFGIKLSINPLNINKFNAASALMKVWEQAKQWLEDLLVHSTIEISTSPLGKWESGCSLKVLVILVIWNMQFDDANTSE